MVFLLNEGFVLAEDEGEKWKNDNLGEALERHGSMDGKAIYDIAYSS